MRNLRVAAAVVSAAILSLTLFQTALAAHPFWKAGVGGIAPTWGMDLDTGVFNTIGGQDLFLNAVSNKERYIGNDLAASILRMSARPSYAKCASATLGSHSYRTSLNVGRWFCVHTTEDRYARFKITQDTNGSYLVIKYKTWCKLTDPC